MGGLESWLILFFHRTRDNDVALVRRKKEDLEGIMSDAILTHDGTPLKTSLNRALFHHKLRALLLIAPLLVFFIVAYITPIFSVLYKSVDNDVVY